MVERHVANVKVVGSIPIIRSIFIGGQMKTELQNQLFEKYPKIFTQRFLPITESAMAFGIGCPDNWYNLIDTLCGQIQAYVDNQKSKVRKTIIPTRPFPQVEATQIKSKFGGLRFYYNGGDQYIKGLVSMAEAMSYKIT